MGLAEQGIHRRPYIDGAGPVVVPVETKSATEQSSRRTESSLGLGSVLKHVIKCQAIEMICRCSALIIKWP